MAELHEVLRYAAGGDSVARRLVPVLVHPSGVSSAGFPYLQQRAWESFRDTVPHLLGMGQRVLDASERLRRAVDGSDREEEAKGSVANASSLVRQVVLTAAITAPCDLWRMRHVLGAFAELGLLRRLLQGEAVYPESCEVEIEGGAQGLQFNRGASLRDLDDASAGGASAPRPRASSPAAGCGGQWAATARIGSSVVTGSTVFRGDNEAESQPRFLAETSDKGARSRRVRSAPRRGRGLGVARSERQPAVSSVYGAMEAMMNLQVVRLPGRRIVILACSLLWCAVAAGAAWVQQDHTPSADSRALDSWSERAALEARQRESAELLVARREADSGRRFDRRYREWLVGAVAEQAPEALQELLSGADEPGPILGLGDSASDLVYTPVPPCRVFDTRFSAGGILVGGTQQNFRVAGSTGFPTQGGNLGGCGIPFGPATSVVINFAAVTPSGRGNLRAWAVSNPQPNAPLAAVMNFSPTMAALANGIAVPICNAAVTSCAAGDLRLQADVSSVHVVGDVVGYFAAPVATPLDCITISSAMTPVPFNQWTAVDANCPGGRTATGGGYFTNEGSLGYPNVWLLTLPNGNGWRTWVDNQNSGNRNIQTFARCCRIPGR